MHIINLATQVLIATQSKAKFYSANSEDGHVLDTTGTDREEIGLVRAICVKVQSLPHESYIDSKYFPLVRHSRRRNARNFSNWFRYARINHHVSFLI